MRHIGSITKGILSLLIVCVLISTAAAEEDEKADVIYVNGRIWPKVLHTSDCMTCKSDPIQDTAIAISEGRILRAGKDKEIRQLSDSHTKVIDLHGHFVMPGFNDAHAHMASGGFEKLDVNLKGAKSLAEMQQRIAARAKTAAVGEWIVGRGWDHTLWSSQTLPSRQDLDAVTGGHPAIFTRVDGHISVANSAALKFAGITRASADPAGGKIDRDAAGEPTGILRETAKDEVLDKLPKPTPAQRRHALELALADAAQSGVTSVQDYSDWEDFLTFEELEREGKLTARISEWLPFDTPLSVLEQHRAHHPQSDPMLHTGMLKAFMDGSLGSRTAALLQPYSDDAKNSGLPQYEQSKLNQMAAERAAAGFQLGFHAIGDRAVEMALNAFEAAESYVREHPAGGQPKTDFRFRVEHAQVTTPQQFARFHDLGVIASMQPNHLLTDMNWALSRPGPQRAKTAYAWREFLKDGVHLAFGTDYPVEPITPFRGIYAAVTRKNEAGDKKYFPEQALTIDEALVAYTAAAAYAEFAEKEKGTLGPGMLADFVVLDRDLTAIPPAEILKTKVLRTVVGGKTVYEAR